MANGSETAIGAEFFQGIKITLQSDGCELLGTLVRATSTGFGSSNAEPAGHLALGAAAKKLNEAALASADNGWLAAELMLGAQLLQAIGSELEKKYFVTIHGGVKPTN